MQLKTFIIPMFIYSLILIIGMNTPLVFSMGLNSTNTIIDKVRIHDYYKVAMAPYVPIEETKAKPLNEINSSVIEDQKEPIKPTILPKPIEPIIVVEEKRPGTPYEPSYGLEDRFLDPTKVRLIPQRCRDLRGLVLEEADTYMSGIPFRGYFGALIQHESCITTTHSRCCSPKSQLKTSREEGAGLGQITKAFKSDGSIRFDKLDEMRKAYRDELHELSWKTIYDRPDLQVRAIIILSRENHRRLISVKDDYERWSMTNLAYNGGIGAVNKARIACGLTKNCNPDVYWGHVERYNPKSTKPLYGNRSAKDINQQHTKHIMRDLLPRYNSFYIFQGE